MTWINNRVKTSEDLNKILASIHFFLLITKPTNDLEICHDTYPKYNPISCGFVATALLYQPDFYNK